MLCEERCMSLAKAFSQAIRMCRTATFHNRLGTFLRFLQSPWRRGRVSGVLF